MSPNTSPSVPRCNFADSNGRRCRLSRAIGHPSLCTHHWRRAALASGLPDPAGEALVAHTLGNITDYRSATTINEALGLIVTLLARNQLSPRRAAVISYTLQILLQSQPGTRQEYANTYGPQAAIELDRRAVWNRQERPPFPGHIPEFDSIDGDLVHAPAISADEPAMLGESSGATDEACLAGQGSVLPAAAFVGRTLARPETLAAPAVAQNVEGERTHRERAEDDAVIASARANW